MYLNIIYFIYNYFLVKMYVDAPFWTLFWQYTYMSTNSKNN